MTCVEARSIGTRPKKKTAARAWRRAREGAAPARRAMLLITLALVMAVVSTSCRTSGRVGLRASAPDPSVAAGWRTWVLKPPASAAVEPPPAPGSNEEGADKRRLEHLADDASGTLGASVRRWIRTPPVEQWLELNLRLVSGRDIDPPSAARGYALTSVAIYDAVVAAWHWKERYRRDPPHVQDALVHPGPEPSYPSEHAAIAGAASRVLAYLFPERPRATFDRMAARPARARVIAGANYPATRGRASNSGERSPPRLSLGRDTTGPTDGGKVAVPTGRRPGTRCPAPMPLPFSRSRGRGKPGSSIPVAPCGPRRLRATVPRNSATRSAR